MAPSANGTLNRPNSPHALPVSTNLNDDLRSRYLRESPAFIMPLTHSPSAKFKPKSWWRAQCTLYGIPTDEEATVAELRASLESAVNKQGGLSVVEEIPAEAAESRRETSEKIRKMDIAVRDVPSVGGKDASAKESASGSAMEGGKGKGKGKKPAEKDRDVLKAVKSGPKVSKKAVKKVITKTVISKTVKLSKKKVPKTEFAPPPPPPPEESLDVDPYEGEPMMWPMEMDIDESNY